MSESVCGERQYGKITLVKMEKILSELRRHGATVSGDNPWDVDTGKHRIKLRGSWNQADMTLTITVTAKNWYVPCSRIWRTIDDLIHEIQEAATGEVDQAREAGARSLCGERRYGNIDKGRMDEILRDLKNHGATVVGSNPWDVDTHQHGVKLRGAWDPDSSHLTVTVTAKRIYVSCSRIWDLVDSLLRHIEGSTDAELFGSSTPSGMSLCGERHYPGISRSLMDAILQELREHGATVTGNNPWDVDLHHGIKLRGTWDQRTGVLSVIVTAKPWYVPCALIWRKLDPVAEHIASVPESELPNDERY
ncbi:MAG: hypothetical protein AAGD06_31735 [Acidobacteriota bacterium]